MSNGKALITKGSLYKELTARRDGIRGVLPVQHQAQVDRFISIAVLTFLGHKQRDKLALCTPESVCQCVMEAAGCGFALDNKFAYVIPYNNKVIVNGRDEWRYEAQCQFDYKALIAMARRSGAVLDARAQVVCQNDEFEWWDECGKQAYKFRESQGDRGPITGAYAVVMLPGGTYRFSYMALSELQKVRKASKSPDSPAWRDWPDRMYCKAVLKRGLIGLQDDPGLIKMIDLDNREYDLDQVSDGKASESRLRSYDELAEHLEATAPEQLAIEHQPESEPVEVRQEQRQPETVPASRTQRAEAAKATRPSIDNHPAGIRG